MRKPLYHNTADAGQGQFSNPRIVVQEHRGAPLLNGAGLTIVRQLIERLGIVATLDRALNLLRRHKPYAESDHILTLIYNLLSGGDTLHDVNRLSDDPALLRVLGAERVPHATTIGAFLARFAKRKQPLRKLREAAEAIQQKAFALLPKERRAVATLDWDSSNHEVYGEKKEGADFAYDNTWCYSVLYGTLAETGDVLCQQLREGNTYTSAGVAHVLPGTIERVKEHFESVRMRGDSGFYDQRIVEICADHDVEFFIVAKQHRNVLKAVQAIPESGWRSLRSNQPPRGGASGQRRKKRQNRKRRITVARKPDTWFKGQPTMARSRCSVRRPCRSTRRAARAVSSWPGWPR